MAFPATQELLPPTPLVFSALHGTTTAVVPADAARVVLKPAIRHGKPPVWPEHTAPRDYLYLGDHVAAYFAHYRAMKDGHQPILARVEVPLDSLHYDPAWYAVLNEIARKGKLPWPPPQGLATPGASFTDCGRIATTADALVIERFLCHNTKQLGQLLTESRLSHFILKWPTADSWWPRHTQTWRPGRLPTQYPECRQAIGELIIRECFTKV
jgi:hypothetical protein